jgi:flagellar FliL protein
MAKKNKTEGGEGGGEGGGKGGKSRLVMVAVVAIGVAGGVKGFVLGGGDKAAVAMAGAPTTTTTAPGPIVTLEPITLNIAGGRFLKIGLGLQLSGEHVGEGHGADSDDPTKGYARALDITIEVLGGRPFEELVTPEGRTAAKEELTRRLREAYHDEVEGVYFTEFVMQ